MKMVDDRHEQDEDEDRDESSDFDEDEWVRCPITGKKYNRRVIREIEEEWQDRGLIQ